MSLNARKGIPEPKTEQERFRRGNRKRIVYSVVGALIVLALVVLLGPSGTDVRRRWEFSGKEGPLRLMPELSIDDGGDAVHQDAAAAGSPPAAAPNYESVSPEAEQKAPPPSPPATADRTAETDPESDPELDAVDAVEMRLPAQTNPWFRLIRMVRPRYPADASAADMRQPQVIVEVAFYVDPSGKVAGSYIMSNTGGDAFARVVLKAVDQWLYRPVILPDGEAPQGFWNRLTIFFRTPLQRLRVRQREDPERPQPSGVE